MPPDVCFVLGTRPNFVKAAPLHRMLQVRHPELRPAIVHTGQHYDESMSDVFLEQLGLPLPDLQLEAGSGSHAEQTAAVLVGVERALLELRPRLLVVVGDVNSTLGAALAAVKLGVPVAHLEAGLRSYDPTMPEEHNRRLTDHLSSLLLAPSEDAVANLVKEGLEPDRIDLVGNTMIDSLLMHLESARAGSRRTARGEYGLVTLHRPEVVDDPDLLAATVEALRELALASDLVFPVHPRTRARLELHDLVSRLEDAAIELLPPQSYLDFLGLQAHAAFVLTDSGGVQEETAVLGVPCFTFRRRTERPVTVARGTNTVLGVDPSRIPSIPRLLERSADREEIPFWDGRAGERAADAVAAFLAAADVGERAAAEPH